MKSCKEYREQAYSMLTGKWDGFVVASLVILGISLLGSLLSALGAPRVGSSLSFALSILLVIPFEYALMITLLNKVRGQELEFSVLHDCIEDIKQDYDRLVVSGLLMTLIVGIIAILTLLIGGIILGLAYSMVPFILHDHPNMSSKEALQASRLMMRGHKMELFLLNLSFLGWIILAILTCGIGFLWLMPYMGAAQAAFYEDISKDCNIEVVD